MQSGWVLDLSNARFRDLMRAYDVDIDGAQYCVDGESNSKAKRFRVFLRTAPSAVVAKVLEDLLDLRQISAPDELSDDEVRLYRGICQRLKQQAAATAETSGAEDNLLNLVFRPEELEALPIDRALIDVLSARMTEAKACVAARAYLSAVIIAGSVLEGLCLGYGKHNVEAVNRAFAKKYQKPTPAFYEWKLAQWIEVLASMGVFTPNVEKFGQALRDFRNYIHPSQQLASGFTPDQHTASISVQVVVAAISDLARAMSRPKEPVT